MIVKMAAAIENQGNLNAAECAEYGFEWAAKFTNTFQFWWQN